MTALLLVAACGARSSLLAEATEVGAGGAGVTGAGGAVAMTGSGAGGEEPTCRVEDLSTWHVERYRDAGDYERVAVAVSGFPWAALKPRGGDIVLAKLALDAQGIALDDSIALADSAVYPAALDVDDRRFVLLTSSAPNWNGDIELWRIDRQDGTVLRVPVGDPPADPADTIYSAIGLAGDDVAIAYARPAEADSMIELRDDALGVLETLPMTDASFTAVRTSDSAVDLYGEADTRVHVESGTLSQELADPAWQVIGGLDGFLVEIGNEIRVTHDRDVWSASWPHSQISPPAIARSDGGRVAFSLETELTAVVGHTTGGALQWLPIEAAPDAPGTGLGLVPIVDAHRLGLFYLGLEIPNPEQPLRYFGLTCP